MSTLDQENTQLKARIHVLEQALEQARQPPPPTTTTPTPTTTMSPTKSPSLPSPPSTLTQPHDPADFQAWGQHILSWLVEYRTSCQDLPVLSTVQPNYLRDALPDSAPTQGESWQAIMEDLNTLIVPGLTHWESSRKFFAYFKPHSSYPAVLGETLCAGLNVMGFDWIASPACTELEVVTLDWLAKILHLPKCFLSSDSGPGGGVIQGSAGESATVALTAAIERTRSCTGGSAISVNGGPLRRDLMVVYGSDQTHTIVKKACMILGVRWRPLPTGKAHDWALQPDVLQHAIEEDRARGLTPIACVATTGTILVVAG
jgi:tyrosine decarboxylase